MFIKIYAHDQQKILQRFEVVNQVGSTLGQNDLLAEESGPLLPSVLPAPEVLTVLLKTT